MLRFFLIFSFAVIALTGYFIGLPMIGDAKKLASFEEIVEHDKINRDFKWAEHVGYYSNTDAKLCSDVCLALLYSGRVKTMTTHEFTETGITRSDRFWLENREICPDPSKMFHQSYNYELRWVRDFHETMGLCLIMGEATPLTETMQVIYSRDRSFPSDGPHITYLRVLRGTQGPYINPKPADILAQRTVIDYQDTPRLRVGLYAGIGFHSLQKRFISKKIHQPYTGTGYSFKHYPRAGIRPVQALRYITNLGRPGLEKAEFNDQKKRLESADGLVPSKEDVISIISQEFSKLQASDFPLENRYKLFLRYKDSRQFTPIDESALRDAREELSVALMHASTQELIFLTPTLNFEQLIERENLGGHQSIRHKSVRNRKNYPAYKQALIEFAKAMQENQLVISRDQMEYKHRELTKVAINNVSRILAYDEFDESLANLILDIITRHDSETFEFKEVLKKHSWKNTKAVDEILNKIESKKLSDFGVRDNLSFLSYMSKESLLPHRNRVLAAVDQHGGIKNSTTRKRMQQKLKSS